MPKVCFEELENQAQNLLFGKFQRTFQSLQNMLFFNCFAKYYDLVL